MLFWNAIFLYFLAVVFGSATAFVELAGRNLRHGNVYDVMMSGGDSASSSCASSSSSSSSSLSAISSSNKQLDPSETAVVFIEYQNEFTTPGGKLHDAVKDVMAATNMLSNSRRVLEAARNAGCTIIHCPISFEPVRTYYCALCYVYGVNFFVSALLPCSKNHLFMFLTPLSSFF
jgi:Isochorismatase family